jgi:hypothetical protein
MDDLFSVTELAKSMEVEEAEAATSGAGTAGQKATEVREREMEKVTEAREENVGVARTRNFVG